VPTTYHCGNSDCECGEKCVALIIAYQSPDSESSPAVNVNPAIVNVESRNRNSLTAIRFLVPDSYSNKNVHD